MSLKRKYDCLEEDIIQSMRHESEQDDKENNPHEADRSNHYIFFASYYNQIESHFTQLKSETGFLDRVKPLLIHERQHEEELERHITSLLVTARELIIIPTLQDYSVPQSQAEHLFAKSNEYLKYSLLNELCNLKRQLLVESNMPENLTQDLSENLTQVKSENLTQVKSEDLSENHDSEMDCSFPLKEIHASKPNASQSNHKPRASLHLSEEDKQLKDIRITQAIDLLEKSLPNDIQIKMNLIELAKAKDLEPVMCKYGLFRFIKSPIKNNQVGIEKYLPLGSSDIDLEINLLLPTLWTIRPPKTSTQDKFIIHLIHFLHLSHCFESSILRVHTLPEIELFIDTCIYEKKTAKINLQKMIMAFYGFSQSIKTYFEMIEEVIFVQDNLYSKIDFQGSQINILDKLGLRFMTTFFDAMNMISGMTFKARLAAQAMLDISNLLLIRICPDLHRQSKIPIKCVKRSLNKLSKKLIKRYAIIDHIVEKERTQTKKENLVDESLCQDLQDLMKELDQELDQDSTEELDQELNQESTEVLPDLNEEFIISNKQVHDQIVDFATLLQTSIESLLKSLPITYPFRDTFKHLFMTNLNIVIITFCGVIDTEKKMHPTFYDKTYDQHTPPTFDTNPEFNVQEMIWMGIKDI